MQLKPEEWVELEHRCGFDRFHVDPISERASEEVIQALVDIGITLDRDEEYVSLIQHAMEVGYTLAVSRPPWLPSDN